MDLAVICRAAARRACSRMRVVLVHQHKLILKRSKGDSTCAVNFGIRVESIRLRFVSKEIKISNFVIPLFI